MATKHTSGEWRASRHCVYSDDKMIAISSVVDVKDYDERIANLNLMAAAPNLLDALQSCLYLIEELGVRDGNAIEDAKHAIQKATNHYQ